MGKLRDLGIITSKESKSEIIFDKLHTNFLKVKYTSPSEYVRKSWNKYLALPNKKSQSLNGLIFEHILATICIRENMLPIYKEARVAFVPNVLYDLMFYSAERGPICWSVKTSLRERYKQADLEAISLKYVHRKALCYLLTLDEAESKSVKLKIQSGEVIGLDDVILATSKDFDNLIITLKKINFSNPPTVNVIESNKIITQDKVNSIK